MRTANLTGAILDYHTARAECVPAADLELRANGTLCVRYLRGDWGPTVAVQVLDYSTNWALTGPLVEKHEINLHRWKDDTNFWAAEFAYTSHYHDVYASDYEEEGCDTPLIAICRAVVRAAFGDEVEDLPCA